MRCNAQFNTKGDTELWAGYIHWSILQVRKAWTYCNAYLNIFSHSDIFIGSTHPVRQLLNYGINSLNNTD